MAEELDQTLDGMREKTRALNDSLKSLNAEGLDNLSRLVASLSSAARQPRQRPAENIVVQELSALLRRELVAGIAAAFGRTQAPAAGGAGTLSVIIHNNSPAQVTATETTDGFDRRALEITIDQMVASSLARGAETTGILRTLFGLFPNLIGR